MHRKRNKTCCWITSCFRFGSIKQTRKKIIVFFVRALRSFYSNFGFLTHARHQIIEYDKLFFFYFLFVCQLPFEFCQVLNIMDCNSINDEKKTKVSFIRLGNKTNIKREKTKIDWTCTKMAAWYHASNAFAHK